MNKTLLLSVKTWALFCFYASIAMLLYVPIYGSVYNCYILIIAALVVFARRRDDFILLTLSASVILSSVFRLISHYYDQNYLSTMSESMGGKLYYAVWFIVSVSPLIYCLFKTHDSCIKTGIAILFFALIPSLFYALTSPRLVDISLLVFSIALTGFFCVSALDTNDNTTRNISILAGLGALTMMFYNVENIIWYFCDKPQMDGWYSWIDYDKDKFPVFDFCIEYSRVFTWSLLVGCALMLIYFVYLFKRSNFTLKAICLPAIIAFVLIWLLSNGVHSSVGFLNHKYLTSFFDIIVYTLFAFSFYKLNKKL